jgi:hypothetical protein
MNVSNRSAEDVWQDTLNAFKRVSRSGAFMRGWLWGYGAREETAQYF